MMTRIFPAATAALLYAIYGWATIAGGHPEDLLWSCHLALLVTGGGFLLRSANGVAIGFLWSAFGLPFYSIYLAGGGELLLISLLAHIGGLLLGWHGISLFGMPRGTWWKASVLLFVLQQVCRWATPREANVNLAHDVWPGWEPLFSSYTWYIAALASAGALFFLALEVSIRRGGDPGKWRGSCV